MLYQVHRWAPGDAVLWQRMGVLSFLMTDRDWLKRGGKEASHLADMGAVNAELYLGRAVALDPGDPQRHFWLGWVRHALYQNALSARGALAEALVLDPRHPYALAALARIEVAEALAGYEARAIALLEKASARLPESARFHYDMGACLAGLGYNEEAKQAFARAVASPALPPGEGAMGRYVAQHFHADPASLRPLIERLVGHLFG